MVARATKAKGGGLKDDRLVRRGGDVGARVLVRERLAWMEATPRHENIKWHSHRADYEVELTEVDGFLDVRLRTPVDVSRSDLKGALRVVQQALVREQRVRGIRPRIRPIRGDRRIERGIFFLWLSGRFVPRKNATTRSEWIAEVWQDLTTAWLEAAWTNAAQTTLEKWPQAIPAYWEWVDRYGPSIPDPEWDVAIDEALGDSVSIDDVRQGLRAAEAMPRKRLRDLAKRPKSVDQMVEVLSAENVDVVLKRTRILLR